jgi:hypothetical protein
MTQLLRRMEMKITEHTFGTSRLYEGGYYTRLSIKPNGFSSNDPLRARIEVDQNGRIDVDISWSSGGYNDDCPPVERTLNMVAAMVYVTEWVESELEKLNKER